jgi:hypothetical protein
MSTIYKHTKKLQHEKTKQELKLCDLDEVLYGKDKAIQK